MREAETLSVELLGVVVYEVLFSHLDRLQESAYSVQEGRPRVDLQEQRREYEAKADCYRDDSMEKFFALKRLAEDNVVAAADMGNLWAMDRLARLECRKGHLQEAAGLWEQAAQMHYPAAGLHLALYIYGPGCEREDVRQYRLWLEQASQDGSARASCELAKQNLSSDPFLSGMLLARAEEQNQGKFNLHVYRTIRELQQKLVLLSDGVM